ncbi:MAG: methyl-accepting chemotaxis protein [Candidatus Thiodiazotropha sp.]
MFILRNLSISSRLWLIISIAIIGFSVLTVMAPSEFYSGMMEAKQAQTNVLVQSVDSIISNYYDRSQRGEMSEEEAKKQALEKVSVIRYDDTNYFWVNDYNSRILMHPLKPELNNTDGSRISDPNGKKIFIESAQVASKSGEGVINYQWVRTGSSKPVDKISCVHAFEPWEWVVSTGIYVDDVQDDFWNNAMNMGIIALLVLTVLLSLSISITRSIVKPLGETIAALDDISMGDGDLTKRLDEKGKDEISKLSIAFNRFSEKILQIVIQVTHIRTQLATAADELASTTNQTHENITNQQSETHQVATAVTEMAATVKEIAESAEGAAANAHEADGQAQKGKLVVVDVTSAINDLAKEMNSASDVINLLAKESESIGSVSDVIRGIAEQTSLLALNAAIEAARAGEQGRGFAVVADEVRSLASRTQQATTEIRDMIERLQSGTQNAVNVIKPSGETTQVTVEKARTAAESLDQIVSSVALISDRNTQIANASDEQSAVATEIDRSVIQISQLAEHSALASEQIAQATAELSKLGDNLHDMISQFKTA